MKNDLPTSNDGPTGAKYWRSLDALAGTPEFNEWVEREFPVGASEFPDGVSRRNFVKVMSASFLLAGLGAAGCRRPEEKILPFSKMPEDYVHGVSKYYATAMPTPSGAQPLVVRAHEGRPVKVLGNEAHPDSTTATDSFTQASLLDLYDPDRAQRFAKGGKDVTPDAALAEIGKLSSDWLASKGEGVAFLVERSNSPSRARLQKKVREKLPKASWHVYEPVDSIVPGLRARPIYSFENAEVVVSLDGDFLGTEPGAVRNTRGYSKSRKMQNSEDTICRLYVVEALLSLTGSNADHRLRVAASQILKVAAEIASGVLTADREIGGRLGSSLAEILDELKQLSGASSKHADWARKCAADLAAHKGKCLVVPGQRQPRIVHEIAHALNVALGNVGSTVEYIEVETEHESDISSLAKKLDSGLVSSLIILGGNPVYNAPSDLDWAKLQAKATTSIRLGYYEDETAAIATHLVPRAHYLESWGDARTAEGTLVPIQPLIRPLFNGLTELEFLARLLGEVQTGTHEIVRETFKDIAGSGNFEYKWEHFLHDGFFVGGEGLKKAGRIDWAASFRSLMPGAQPAEPTASSLEVVLHSDYSLFDGRYSNNGWLQELPDPITKMTWDNAFVLSKKTADELGVATHDVLSITVDGKTVEAPALIQPGTADNTIGFALGYGRKTTGRVGEGAGFNAYALRTSAKPSLLTGAKATKTGRIYKLAGVQDHWTMAGRSIVREVDLASYREHPDFASRMGMEAHVENEGGIYKHPYDQYSEKVADGGAAYPITKSEIHQWGMSIDLNSCTGCNACVVACQSENNVPIVGKEQVAIGREMHWIRIDRYFSTGSLDDQENHASDPEVSFQPVVCMHCDNAPCESVCPVNATVHDEEGLNVMVYNRCVGTRYCSNNCPYKVRRFNFFDYNKRPLKELMKGPLASKSQIEYDLMELIKNPDVSVRMRGVMEKCTFCVQRIEAGKIAQKVKAGASGDVAVPDGAIRTACQEACPAEAIVFGNLQDETSKVSKAKRNERDYKLLGYLDTRPRTTYLAKVRNPNSDVPGAHTHPLSFSEYSEKNGNPFEHHGGDHGDDHAADAHSDGGQH